MSSTITVLDQQWDENRTARAALSWLVEAASTQLGRALEQSDPIELWRDISRVGIETWRNRARSFELDQLLARSARSGVRFIIPGDAEWPKRLAELALVQHDKLGGEPLGLWLRGPADLAEATVDSIAIVGSRACTPYGERCATDLAMDLAGPPRPEQPGTGEWTILSGGAFGIDGWAHRGALAAGGKTVAVLANGLDVPYPRGNQLLFDKLAAEHLLVSEVPVGRHPTKVGFLARNRLLAAMARATIVVEAAARSGAANTASWAKVLGRDLMAVPGPITSAQSVTPHRLVRDREATLVADALDVEAVLAPLGRSPRLPTGGAPTLLDALPDELLMVREALPGRGGLPTGVVSDLTGRPVREVMASLAQLADLGLARRDEQDLWHLASGGRS